jgi:hypothetical protein
LSACSCFLDIHFFLFVNLLYSNRLALSRPSGHP